MWVFLILEPARLLGACKPGSRARMDSRTGHGTYIGVDGFKGKISDSQAT